MSREATAATVTASQLPVARPVALVRIALDSGEILASTDWKPISWAWDGGSPEAVFEGLGNLGKISAVEEGVEIAPYSVSFQLSGIPQSQISIALSEDYRNRDVRVWLGLLDEQHQLIEDPVLLARMLLDTMNLELGDTAIIEATAHSRLVEWERPRIRRFTNADQQAIYPNDKGLEFVPTISAGKELIWGRG